VIQETGNWIRNADTKATVLAAALALTISTAVTHCAGVVDAYHGRGGVIGRWIIIVASLLAAATLLLSIVNVYKTLLPRTSAETTFNRFGWPSIAASSHPPTKLDPAGLRDEAWRQSYQLALIAQAKFHHFRLGLRFFLSAIFFLSFTFIAVAAGYSETQPFQDRPATDEAMRMQPLPLRQPRCVVVSATAGSTQSWLTHRGESSSISRAAR
jgi:hypothetical protein